MEKPFLSTSLLPCPCCNGKAELSDMMVSNTQMWQVHCSVCGLASELDDDREFSIQLWNRRLEVTRLKMWLTLSLSALPLIAIVFFLIGSFAGLNFSL